MADEDFGGEGGGEPEVKQPEAPAKPEVSVEPVDPVSHDDVFDDNYETAENHPGSDAHAGTEMPKELQERATEYGFTEEDVKSFGSPENLERALQAFDRRMMRTPAAAQAQQQSQQTQQVQQTMPNMNRQQQQAVQQAQLMQAYVLQELSKVEKNIEPENYGALKNVFGRMASTIDAILGQVVPTMVTLQSTTANLQSAEQTRIEVKNEQEFDSGLDELPDAYNDLVGKTGKLREGSDQWKMREEIWGMVPVLIHRYQQQGVRVPSVSVLAQRAAQVVCADKTRELARNELNSQNAQRRGQSLGRPRGQPGTSRKGSALAEVLGRLHSQGEFE